MIYLRTKRSIIPGESYPCLNCTCLLPGVHRGCIWNHILPYYIVGKKQYVSLDDLLFPVQFWTMKCCEKSAILHHGNSFSPSPSPVNINDKAIKCCFFSSPKQEKKPFFKANWNCRSNRWGGGMQCRHYKCSSCNVNTSLWWNLDGNSTFFAVDFTAETDVWWEI